VRGRALTHLAIIRTLTRQDHATEKLLLFGGAVRKLALCAPERGALRHHDWLNRTARHLGESSVMHFDHAGFA
jgi:hypothetical protein